MLHNHNAEERSMGVLGKEGREGGGISDCRPTGRGQSLRSSTTILTISPHNRLAQFVS